MTFHRAEVITRVRPVTGVLSMRTRSSPHRGAVVPQDSNREKTKEKRLSKGRHARAVKNRRGRSTGRRRYGHRCSRSRPNPTRSRSVGGRVITKRLLSSSPEGNRDSESVRSRFKTRRSSSLVGLRGHSSRRHQQKRGFLWRHGRRSFSGENGSSGEGDSSQSTHRPHRPTYTNDRRGRLSRSGSRSRGRSNSRRSRCPSRFSRSSSSGRRRNSSSLTPSSAEERRRDRSDRHRHYISQSDAATSTSLSSSCSSGSSRWGGRSKHYRRKLSDRPKRKAGPGRQHQRDRPEHQRSWGHEERTRKGHRRELRWAEVGERRKSKRPEGSGDRNRARRHCHRSRSSATTCSSQGQSRRYRGGKERLRAGNQQKTGKERKPRRSRSSVGSASTSPSSPRSGPRRFHGERGSRATTARQHRRRSASRNSRRHRRSIQSDSSGNSILSTSSSRRSDGRYRRRGSRQRRTGRCEPSSSSSETASWERTSGEKGWEGSIDGVWRGYLAVSKKGPAWKFAPLEKKGVGKKNRRAVERSRLQRELER